jgi:transcriptional regulator with XRE-family HTH domain
MALNLCRMGQLLRETREKKGLTLDEASNALFIRKQVVGAIEAGDWDNLPHPVYVKGYVKHYAILLGAPGLLDESEAASCENGSPAIADPAGLSIARPLEALASPRWRRRLSQRLCILFTRLHYLTDRSRSKGEVSSYG